MFIDVTDSLDTVVNGERLCVVNKNLGKAIEMDKRFGSPSAFGEAWIGFTFKNGYKVAVKKMPLGRWDQGVSFTRKQLLSGDSVWAEMAAYMLCSILVMAKICPNLPILYKYFWCPKCHFENRYIKPKVQPCLLVVNELADGDLKFYLEKRTQIWTNDLITNCLFQIAAGLYSLEKFYNLSHNDLHFGNVLVHEIIPGGYWHYRIDGDDYYVPNLGYLFVLWDFGMAHIPGKIRGRPEFDIMDDFPVPDETDIGRIAAVMQEPLTTRKARKLLGGNKPHDIMRKIIRNETRQQPVKAILDSHFKLYRTTKPPPGQLIESYNMDVSKSSLKAAHPAELRQFLS